MLIQLRVTENHLVLTRDEDDLVVYLPVDEIEIIYDESALAVTDDTKRKELQ